MRFAVPLLLMLFALAPGALSSAFPVSANDEWPVPLTSLPWVNLTIGDRLLKFRAIENNKLMDAA